MSSGIPDELRFPIIFGCYSPALARLIRAQIADEESRVILEAVAGPELVEAALERADELAGEWVPIGGGVEEKRGPARAKRLVVDEICRGEWPR